MVTTRQSAAAQPQASSRLSSSHYTSKTPDPEPIALETTRYSGIELLRAYVGAAAMLKGLVHAARNPKVFD